MSRTSRVYHNRLTHQVWVGHPNGESRLLGTAGGAQAVGLLMSSNRLIRTGDWLKAYGPVRVATVWTEVPS